MSRERSGISNASQRMAAAGELLERAIGVVFLATGLVVITCVMALFAAFTFAVLHNGDDFDFAWWSGGGTSGDVIVLPAQPF